MDLKEDERWRIWSRETTERLMRYPLIPGTFGKYLSRVPGLWAPNQEMAYTPGFPTFYVPQNMSEKIIRSYKVIIIHSRVT